MSDKYASDLPLPGGVEQYYETLVALLQRVAADSFDYAQLQDLVREVCPNAKKSTAIGQYIGLIRMMGYWSQDERGIYRVTSEGSQLLELDAGDPLKAKRFVLLNKVRDFAGYDIILAFLALGQQISMLFRHI